MATAGVAFVEAGEESPHLAFLLPALAFGVSRDFRFGLDKSAVLDMDRGLDVDKRAEVDRDRATVRLETAASSWVMNFLLRGFRDPFLPVFFFRKEELENVYPPAASAATVVAALLIVAMTV
jgi:hypothetical protein